MSPTENANETLTYKKKPEPCRIVSLSTLRKTQSTDSFEVSDYLVSSLNGAKSGNWAPMPRLATTIAVSPSSWKGLRDRVRATSRPLLEVA